MSNQVMTEDEQIDFIKQGGEFGQLVSKLTIRAIDAETLSESLQTTVHLQEAQILSLQRRLANAETQRDDANRDVGLMNDAENKIAAILRETRAQRVATPAVRHEARQELTGAPMHPRELQVVRRTAEENESRERRA
ncbi:MAG TPA: hypothetical protein VNY06_01100 [Methylocella sp.]|jgi:hypothetical protein|nr:hypothetical protein [Methylocella sp.]